MSILFWTIIVLLVTIRPGVQRVMDVQVVGPNILPAVQRVYAGIQPLSALKSLPLSEGRVTSMYYDHWPLKGDLIICSVRVYPVLVRTAHPTLR